MRYRALNHSVPYCHFSDALSRSLKFSARPRISNNRESLPHILFVNLFSRFSILSIAAHRYASHSRIVIMCMSKFPIPRVNGSFPRVLFLFCANFYFRCKIVPNATEINTGEIIFSILIRVQCIR